MVLRMEEIKTEKITELSREEEKILRLVGAEKFARANKTDIEKAVLVINVMEGFNQSIDEFSTYAMRKVEEEIEQYAKSLLDNLEDIIFDVIVRD